MREIRTIILVLAGMVTALLIGAVGAPMMTTQTAEARQNCELFEDNSSTCSGGQGSAGGGSGQHRECTASGDCHISGGEGGRGGGIVGGAGGNLICPDGRQFPEQCRAGPGGSGVHVQGPGGNSP